MSLGVVGVVTVMIISGNISGGFSVQPGRHTLGSVSYCAGAEDSSGLQSHLHIPERLAGLVVKASASRAEDPGFESHLRWDFFGAESYQ